MNPLLQGYGIFDVCVASELPLPGLAACDTEDPGWTITLPGGVLADGEFEWFHTWTAPGGEFFADCARRGGDYQLNLLNMADFRIYFGELKIEAFPRAGCTDKTLAHMLADQVIPRALCHTGRMVMHASAVQYADGRVVAFTGPSGRGKSTLASAFRNAGHRLVSDDCVLIEKRAGVVCAVPAYSSLRLWPDSAEGTIAVEERDSDRFSDMVHYSSKKELLIDPGSPLERNWLELSALYLLQEPSATEDTLIHIEPVGGMATVMALVESLFALDVTSKQSLKQYFDTVGSVADGIPVFNLAYLRDYTVLPELVETLVRDGPKTAPANP